MYMYTIPHVHVYIQYHMYTVCVSNMLEGNHKDQFYMSYLQLYIHDVIRDLDRKKERQKERKTPEAMEK